ncbi:MAG TPA: hypothetical protein VFA65_05600 [Bryobacteraceae bacterium]|nr:hypothetical protein [Bryobacteraceae bacterium]
MESKKSYRLAALAFAATLITPLSVATAGEVQVAKDNSTTWQAGVDGVEIEWNPNGSVRRVYSRYGVPVEFADRRGIAKAQIVAEEKAKAGIVRFMQQCVASTRVVTEIQTDLNRATQQRSSGRSTAINKTDERTLIENLTEVTASFASGTLRGVIVLEKGYDDKTQEAWVVVGISQKTIAAARGVRDMTTRIQGSSPSDSTEQSHSIGIQPGEVRQSKQKDW